MEAGQRLEKSHRAHNEGRSIARLVLFPCNANAKITTRVLSSLAAEVCLCTHLSDKLAVLEHHRFFTLPPLRFLISSSSSFRILSRPSFRRASSMTSSVLILVLPAWLANASRSVATFPTVQTWSTSAEIHTRMLATAVVYHIVRSVGRSIDRPVLLTQLCPDQFCQRANVLRCGIDAEVHRFFIDELPDVVPQRRLETFREVSVWFLCHS